MEISNYYGNIIGTLYFKQNWRSPILLGEAKKSVSRLKYGAVRGILRYFVLPVNYRYRNPNFMMKFRLLQNCAFCIKMVCVLLRIKIGFMIIEELK